MRSHLLTNDYEAYQGYLRSRRAGTLAIGIAIIGIVMIWWLA